MVALRRLRYFGPATRTQSGTSLSSLLASSAGAQWPLSLYQGALLGLERQPLLNTIRAGMATAIVAVALCSLSTAAASAAAASAAAWAIASVPNSSSLARRTSTRPASARRSCAWTGARPGHGGPCYRVLRLAAVCGRAQVPAAQRAALRARPGGGVPPSRSSATPTRRSRSARRSRRCSSCSGAPAARSRSRTPT